MAFHRCRRDETTADMIVRRSCPRQMLLPSAWRNALLFLFRRSRVVRLDVCNRSGAILSYVKKSEFNGPAGQRASNDHRDRPPPPIDDRSESTVARSPGEGDHLCRSENSERKNRRALTRNRNTLPTCNNDTCRSSTSVTNSAVLFAHGLAVATHVISQ